MVARPNFRGAKEYLMRWVRGGSEGSSGGDVVWQQRRVLQQRGGGCRAAAGGGARVRGADDVLALCRESESM